MSDGKSRSEKFYGGKDKGSDKKPDGKKEDAKEHPHVAERKETFARHSKARDDLHKQHEEELAAMAARQAADGMTAPGATGAPAAGPMPGANGAAAAVPPAVAGTAA